MINAKIAYKHGRIKDAAAEMESARSMLLSASGFRMLGEEFKSALKSYNETVEEFEKAGFFDFDRLNL